MTPQQTSLSHSSTPSFPKDLLIGFISVFVVGLGMGISVGMVFMAV
ncbi:hypothetical protein CA267_003880 [Alteromonas pelagimontana]|uniref:Uncharacterized protein n=1 Tax=Alteromonas pelagimontana TaxID=1858656 RepID=A0A6M4MBJ8_9ALTE|nr:hypothetical protein [Alteromonas pelagimontana]QJR79980.1 hypothetical protein CA267_003880 [Alteromonas pelagimontana]